MRMNWSIGPALEIGLDRKRNVIHVFDLNEGRTLTNAIDSEFQQEILSRMGEPTQVSDWTWLLYHTDGIVTRYENNQFFPVSQNEM